MNEDSIYMQKALMLARKAAALGEVPIGAVVVAPDGAIIGKGYNRAERKMSQSYHAEVIALQQAGRAFKDWRLEGCTLYVTLAPCVMCYGLTCLSRIERLVYGAESPLFGYHLDNECLPRLYRNHMKGVTSGILAQESTLLLEQFFKQKRKKGEQLSGSKRSVTAKKSRT